MTTLDWNLARAFFTTAEFGSLSAAARALGLTQPTLSRQVAALEAELGTTLFERIGKRLVLTEAGLGLLEPARAMSAAAEDLALAAAGRSQDIGGRVTISASDAISAYLMPALVARIREKAPQITILIVASNAISDLRRREADIAIRHVQPTEPDLIARRVTGLSAHFYASRDWLARNAAPSSLADLSGADILAFDPVDRFVEQLRLVGLPLAADQIRIMSENAVVIWEMVRAGLGIGIMLKEIADRTGGAVRLLPEFPGLPVPVWLVSHRELRTNRRVRLVFDLLAAEFSRGAGGVDPGPAAEA